MLVVQIAGLSLALPTLVASVVCVAWPKRGEVSTGAGSREACAVALAFALAYLALPWAPWKPRSGWHWLPYLALAGAAVYVVAQSRPFWIRVPLYLAVAVATGWLVVPDWEDLQPRRGVYIMTVAAAILLLSVGRTSSSVLRKRTDEDVHPTTRWRRLLPAMVALAAAVVLILSGSMKFGQLALALAGAAAGCAIVVRGSTQQSSSVAPLPFATLLVGLLATGYLYSYSDVPAASYLLVAVAPLATCVASFAPGSRFNRRRRQLAELIAVAAILGLAVGLALI